MKKTALFVIVLLALVLTACQSAGLSPTVEEAFGATSVQTEQPVATAADPTTSGPTISPTGQVGPAQCTVVSSLADSAESAYPPVSDGDWITGPESADVTIIEYSDFQ
jgi:hypothetical protein